MDSLQQPGVLSLPRKAQLGRRNSSNVQLSRSGSEQILTRSVFREIYNLPASEAENMKRQWEGKPIQVHTSLQNCLQTESYRRELAHWKEY